MNEILIPVLLVAGIGLIAGLGLAIASIVMAVPKDEKAEAVNEMLPGANCGACGFSGCAGYAAALAKGEAEPGLCAPGGSEVAAEISAFLGLGEVSMERKTAVVHCSGSYDVTSDKMEYKGIQSCAAAALLGGNSDCQFGCMGLGDCAHACPYDAIELCNGMARVNPERCRACGLCVKTCPKSLISLVTYRKQAVVLCSNCDKGPAAMKVCKVSCIGCKKCERTCSQGAIHVENFCAKIDPAKCTGCGECVEACPRHCISLILENAQ